jgi:MFS superfamily sulfate permease-like transporter
MDIGREQLAIFVITILGVLSTDLLLGVLIGILTKVAIHLARGVKPANLLKISYEMKWPDPTTVEVRIQGSAIFSNFIALKSELAALPDGKTVIFDLSDAFLIDHTVMEFIEHYRQDYIARGGQCGIRGMDSLQASSSHPLSVRRKPLLSQKL